MKHEAKTYKTKALSPKNVVTRFAPSPTGLLHVGSARTALFNYLFVKKHGGKLILRIEDTDQERSKKEFEKDIVDNLAWLGLTFDEVWKQSDRLKIYQKYLEKLIAESKAYISKETPKEAGDRAEIIRFKNPNKKVKFTDLIRGEVEFDTTELGDFVIAKSITEPIFHFANVVDDFEMEVTHIIRGEDHISNTPRHILIQEALGAFRPTYAHIPLILSADRSKLSKRKHGESISVNFYKNAGYLPEALVNFLALLGWNPGTDEEIFSLKELIKIFEISKVQKGGAIFDPKKLDWLNKSYIGELSHDKYLALFGERMKPEHTDSRMIEKIANITKDRISKFDDVSSMKKAGEFEYYFQDPKYEPARLCWNNANLELTKKHLQEISRLISNLSEDNFTDDSVKNIIWPYAEKFGRGETLWPMRFALSGRDKSPDPFTLAGALGKETTTRRIRIAQDKLK